MKRNDILDSEFNNFTQPVQGDENFEAFQLGKNSNLEDDPNPYDSGTSNFKQFNLGFAYGQGLKGNKIEGLENSPELQEANLAGLSESNANGNGKGWFTNVLIWLGLKKEDEYNSFVDEILEDVIPFNNATSSLNTGTLVIGTVLLTVFVLKHKQIMEFFSDMSKATAKATR